MIAVIGPNPIQSTKFPQNPDPIQSNPIQSMDGSNPCPTLVQLAHNAVVKISLVLTMHMKFRLKKWNRWCCCVRCFCVCFVTDRNDRRITAKHLVVNVDMLQTSAVDVVNSPMTCNIATAENCVGGGDTPFQTASVWMLDAAYVSAQLDRVAFYVFSCSLQKLKWPPG